MANWYRLNERSNRNFLVSSPPPLKKIFLLIQIFDIHFLEKYRFYEVAFFMKSFEKLSRYELFVDISVEIFGFRYFHSYILVRVPPGM